MLANVGTQAMFNLSAWDFITDGWTSNTAGKAYGPGQLSLHEMIYGNYSTGVPLTLGGYGSGTGTSSKPALSTGSNADVVIQNLQQNWVPAVIQSALIPVGFRVGKRIMRRPISMGNKLLKQAGLRSVVKL